MKKTAGLLTMISVLVVLFLSAFAVSTTTTKQTNGKVIDVKPFNKLSVSISAHVFIDQGATQKLTIDADAATLDKILAEVDNKNLVIKLQNPGNRIKGDVTIHITVPELEEISVAGSSDVNVKSDFKAEILTLRVSGSGVIDFDHLTTTDLEAKISGSGKIILAGNSDKFDAAVAGSGNVEAFEFVVADFDGKISGSGKCNVNVTKVLGASIAGSGAIIYMGKPVVNSTVAGSGKVKSAN